MFMSMFTCNFSDFQENLAVFETLITDFTYIPYTLPFTYSCNFHVFVLVVKLFATC